jgi:hypothetical protein
MNGVDYLKVWTINICSRFPLLMCTQFLRNSLVCRARSCHTDLNCLDCYSCHSGTFSGKSGVFTNYWQIKRTLGLRSGFSCDMGIASVACAHLLRLEDTTIGSFVARYLGVNY